MQTTGIDIVDNKRIKKILENRRDSFYKRIFSYDEIKYIEDKNHDYKTVAGLFSAKESISKAIGTGIGKVSFKDIEIYHHISGKPKVKFNKTNKALQGIESIEISISHEKEYAISIAMVNWDNLRDINVPKEVKGLLKKRKEDSHKGSYGKVGIIAGSKGMAGSNYLSSTAALKTGSGLVYSFVPDEMVDIMSMKFIEVIVKEIKENLLDSLKDLNGIVLGPGLGVDNYKINMVRELLLCYDNPIVLDADGINCLKDHQEVLRNRKGVTVLTPHPGELAKFLNKTIEDIEANRIYYAMYTSQENKVITVLKGHNTIITDGDKIYINKTGNPGMATAGSGDILTGIIISLICQGIEPLNASILGTYLHGLAGDMAALIKGQQGLIASDILEFIPTAIEKVLNESS